MKSQYRVGRLVIGLPLLMGLSAAQAVSLHNTVMTSAMTWNQDLSGVTSPSATNLVFMNNLDGTSTYMGEDSISMMVGGSPAPVWDYSWNLTADPDPFIAGSFTVTNTSATIQTFDITFSLPISPSFTDGFMTGSLSGSYLDADNSGGATLNLNSWDGQVDGATKMNLFAFAGPCFGAGCSVTIGEVSQGPTAFTGTANNTIGIHMNFALSAGDSASFDTLFEVTPVPLPATLWLFGSGLLAIFGLRRKKVT